MQEREIAVTTPNRASAVLLVGGLVTVACAALGGWLLFRAPLASGEPRETAPAHGPSPVDMTAAPSTVQPPSAPAREDVVQERVIRGTASVGASADEGSEGEIDARAVASQVRTRTGAIRGCYERALRERPSLAGRLVVRFTIGANGRVNSIRPEGLLEAPEVGACVANVIRRMEFPRPSGGAVEFSVPFTFSPG